MTAVTIDTQDARSLKGIEIAATAGQWARCTRRGDGKKFFAIQSQRDPSVRHLVNCQWCSCEDFRRRQQPCKHVNAVKLFVALSKAVAGRN